MTTGRIGGISLGNGWIRNNPDLAYPDGHEKMDDATLMKHLKADLPSYNDSPPFSVLRQDHLSDKP